MGRGSGSSLLNSKSKGRYAGIAPSRSAGKFAAATELEPNVKVDETSGLDKPSVFDNSNKALNKAMMVAENDMASQMASKMLDTAVEERGITDKLEQDKLRANFQRKAKDYVRSRSNLQEMAMDKAKVQAASQPKSDIAPTVSLEPYHNLRTLPADRTFEEINQKFKEISPKFEKKAAPNKYGEKASDEDWYKKRGFIGEAYSKAKKDPAYREPFLKLLAMSELTKRSLTDAESKVIGHLKKKSRDGAPLDDVAHLNLEAGSPLVSENDGVQYINYYKMLLSDPHLRGIVEDRYNKKEFDGIRAPITLDRTFAEAPKATKEIFDKSLHSVTGMSTKNINDIRKALRMPKGKTPGYVAKALKGQPLSRRIYELTSRNDLEEDEMLDRLGLDKVELRESLDLFNKSDFKDNKAGLTDLEKHAIVAYTGIHYSMINKYLRNTAHLAEVYGQSDDPDLKEYAANELYNNALQKEDAQIYSTLAMNGMAKLMAGNETKTVTRGVDIDAPSYEHAGVGDHIYDAGFSSSTNKENWKSMYGVSRNQSVLETTQWIDLHSLSQMQEQDEDIKEDEILIFPGTMFKVDIAHSYKPTLHRGAGASDVQVLAGRQVNVSKLGKSGKMSAKTVAPAKGWDKLDRSYLFTDKQPNRKMTPEEYEDRVGELGHSLYKWLYSRK